MGFGGQRSQGVSGQAELHGIRAGLLGRYLKADALYPWGPQFVCLPKPQLMHEAHVMEGYVQNAKSTVSEQHPHNDGGITV